jgi:hypothetical protein
VEIRRDREFGTRMTDLTTILKVTTNAVSSKDAGDELARRLAELEGLQIDHDDGAGETWIRLLNGQEIRAFVHTARPMLMVAKGMATVVHDTERGLQIVEFQQADAKEFCADLDVLKSWCARDVAQDVVDHVAFSALDLWYICP